MYTETSPISSCRQSFNFFSIIHHSKFLILNILIGSKLQKFRAGAGKNTHKISLFTSVDPLEKKYVELGPSRLSPEAGEGLFAVRDIPADTVFAQYAGFVFNATEFQELSLLQLER